MGPVYTVGGLTLAITRVREVAVGFIALLAAVTVQSKYMGDSTVQGHG